MNIFLILLLFLLINVVAYISMGLDKRKAIKGKFRTSEARLHLMGLCLGAAGIYLGTRGPFHHKRAKPSFMRIVYLNLFVNFAVVALFIYFLNDYFYFSFNLF